MSAAELLVSALCLFVGYWLVSKLLDRPGKDGNGDRSSTPPAAAAGTPPAATRTPPVAARTAAGHGEYLAHDARATLANWYQILGVREDASKAEIIAAYQQRMALYEGAALSMMPPERRARAEATARQLTAAHEIGMRLFR
jgi:hypothetical protein